MNIVGSGWKKYCEGVLTDMNVAIIGAGRMGYKRAQVLQEFDECKLVAVADVSIDAATKITNEFGGTPSIDWKEVVDKKDIDIVIVSTGNDSLKLISIRAIENKKHVLCEKPVGRNLKEIKALVSTANKHGIVFKAGYNHRFHPAILKAKELFDNGVIGKLFFLRCRYGYGGRPGLGSEWRMNKDLSGGGELLDQGSHVVDLFRYFAGNFNTVFGDIQTYFWGKEVEDNAFALFKKRNKVVAQMHVSLTQWKNLFSFEIFGDKGCLLINGLGGWYGPETLEIQIRKPEGGPPQSSIKTFPDKDISWVEEWKVFLQAIKSGTPLISGGTDAYQAGVMVDGVYESSRTRTEVAL